VSFIRKVFGSIVKDKRGSAFIENGLWIALVVLVVTVSAYALANDGIKPKFDSITDTVKDIPVPTFNPSGS
jgi:Flp pilus assembly pilin Flp